MSLIILMKKKNKILIVDDDPEQLKVVSELLYGMPYELILAHDGAQAVKVAKKKKPDIVLMDWQMPIKSGIEAISEIRKIDSLHDTPIILTTGIMVSEDHLKLAFKSGASTYLKKPIGKLELLACIHSMINLTSSNRKVAEKKDQLEQLAKQKDHMISIVAHDLKSPLNKLQGMVQLTKMVGELNEEQHAYVGEMLNLINGGKELIRDLLDIHSFEHHGSTINIGSVNIRDLVSNTTHEFEQQLSKKHIDLQILFELEEDVFETDASFLRRILENLLSNAIKFSEQGTPINLHIYQEDSAIHFSMKDKGPGISEEDRTLMFRKFQKLEAKPTGGESSTGLGLAIIKTLVEKLNGKITVYSELGIGTEFIVSLPIPV